MADVAALVSAPCPGCGASEHGRRLVAHGEELRLDGPWCYVACDDCGSDYLRPRPCHPERLYDGAYHVHARPAGLTAALPRWVARREADRLLRLVDVASPRVFEIGCGNGDLLAALRDRGAVVAGVEPAEGAVRAAHARGLDVVRGSYADAVGEAGSSQLVVSSHVLEHVTAPTDFLREVRRLLTPTGIAVIRTPLARSWDAAVFGAHSGSFDAPYHMMVPTRAALRRLAVGGGLEIVAMSADVVPNDWVHGLRRSLAQEFGLRATFLQPWNPLAALLLWPFAHLSAAAGRPSRIRLVLRRSARRYRPSPPTRRSPSQSG